MLNFEEYVKNAKALKDGIEDLEWRIEYRKLQLRIENSIDTLKPATLNTGSNTLTLSNATLSTVSVAPSVSAGYISSVKEHIYANDEVLGALEYKLDNLKQTLLYLKRFGCLPTDEVGEERRV